MTAGIKRAFTVFIFFTFISYTSLVSTATSSDTLTVGGDNDYPPFSVDRNEHVGGFSIDIIRHILETKGHHVEFNLTKWDKSLELLQENQIDLLAAVYYSPERDSLFELSDPFYMAVKSCFIRKNSPITTLEQALSSSVIVGKESLAEELMQERNTAFQLISVDSEAEALKLLSSGRYDCAITEQQLGHMIKDIESLDNVVEIGILPGTYALCFASKKGDKELIEEINSGLQLSRYTGEYDNIYNRWFNRKGFLSPERMRILRLVGMYVLVIVFVVILWILMLRREVKRKTKQLEFELQERVKAEEALAESEQLTSAFMDNLPLIVIIKDKDSRVLYFNKYLSKVRDAGPWLGKTPSECFPDPERAKFVRESDLKALKNGYSYSKEQLLSFDEEVPHYYDVTKFTIGDNPENMLIGSLYIDVTDRKLANDELLEYRQNLEMMVEQRTLQLINNKNNLESEIETRKKTEALLRESEELFRSIFNYTAVGICLMDLQANFQKVNDAICEISKYSRDEMLTMNVTDVVLSEDWESIRPNINQLIDHEINDYRTELRIKRKDGEIRTLNVWTKLLHDALHNANAIIVSLHDITDVQKGIEAMMEAEQLKTATQLAGAVAHEFNNPLAIIQVTTELIEPMCDDDKGKKLMAKIPKQIKRMQELVDTLKDLKSVKSKDYADGVKILDLHEKKNNH